MLKKKSLISLLCIALTGSIVLSGYSKPNNSRKVEPSSKSSSPITLRLEDDTATSDPEYAVKNKVLKQFKKDNPNVTVQEETEPGTQYHQKLTTEIASDTLGDLFYNWGGSEVKQGVKNKQFMDLTSVVNADPSYKNAFLPNILKGNDVTYHDIKGLWGIPVNITVTGFYYNTEIFKKAGVKPPKTMSDMVNVIKKLKAYGTIPWALGAQDGWRGEHLYTALFYKLNGVAPIYDLASRKTHYASSIGEGPFKEMEQLRDMGAFGPNPGAVSYDMEQSMFESGKAAMNFGLAVLCGNFTSGDSAIKKEIGYFPFPYFSDHAQHKNSIFAGGGLCLSLNAKLTGDKKDVAVKLMKAFTGVKGQQMNADTSALTPTVKVKQNVSTPAGALQAKFMATFNSSKEYAGDITDPDDLSSMLTKLRDVCAGLMNKQLTAVQAAQAMDKQIKDNS